ncbi:hypothetical protein ACFLVG_02970 [Chloroflexota bacterium]
MNAEKRQIPHESSSNVDEGFGKQYANLPKVERRKLRMIEQVSLLVNDTPIELDNFVQGFIYHTMDGILAALKGTGEIKSLDVSIEEDKVTVNLNDATVRINPFVNKIIRNTIVGMVSSLKGVSEIKKVNINIKG